MCKIYTSYINIQTHVNQYIITNEYFFQYSLKTYLAKNKINIIQAYENQKELQWSSKITRCKHQLKKKKSKNEKNNIQTEKRC